jgi:hypothetical protein
MFSKYFPFVSIMPFEKVNLISLKDHNKRLNDSEHTTIHRKLVSLYR